jgi:hypothetical protein
MIDKRTVVAGLALIGLLAINTVFADEIVVTETRADATMPAEDTKRDLAEKSNAAVERAIEAVLADTKLDLDIRLIGPTSVKIAAER